MDINKIRERVTVNPETIGALSTIDPLIAAEALAGNLMKIYLPNAFSLNFIKEMAGRASLHSGKLFSSEAEYVSKIYSPPEVEVLPVCLTGLAGVGKSQTITALRKVLPPPMDFSCDHYHGAIKLISHWYASARGKAGGKQLLSDFVIGSEESCRAWNLAKLLVESRRRANRDGVSLVMLEETQHINTGLGASKITDILLTLAAIGPPVIFVSNYSLARKLLRRNSEDKQRLLSEPRIMLPDHPESQDWKAYVSECIRVSGGHIQVDINDLAAELYRSTFGIKRLAVQLLKLAYIECRNAGRESVKLADITRAYRSSAYTSNSMDVEYLQLHAIQARGTGTRLDLTCPFDLPADTNSNVVKFARADRDDRVNATVYFSALNKSERSNPLDLIPDDMMRATKRERRPPVPKMSDDETEKAFHEIVGLIKPPSKPKK
ncbi:MULTISPECIES: transposase [unclassified Pseudomonas]|uniref:transposase n=1 Tax=unclassified Pseudomonas TaxID=196821 RepID=UPI001CBF26C0|nr:MULTISPECIES: transposase [unclassified Pseudomonas]